MSNQCSTKQDWVGTWVTSYYAGYWKIVDVKPKYAFEAYTVNGNSVHKGDFIGYWAILKKAFNAKNRFSLGEAYCDLSLCKPISAVDRDRMETFFMQNPDMYQNFERYELRLKPMLNPIWLSIPENRVEEVIGIVQSVPRFFTLSEIEKRIEGFQQMIAKPPCSHVMHLLFFPWEQDEQHNMLFRSAQLIALYQKTS